MSTYSVLVHGSDASDHAAEYLAHGADAVMIGESERTVSEVCTLLLRPDGRDMRDIDGLAYAEQGAVHRTRKREINAHPDTLPFPAWHLVDHERYRPLWREHHGFYSINMVTTRGCPYHCNWCAKPVYGQVYHARTPENVVEELRFVQSTIGPDHIWFADDIFGLKPGWVQRFSELLREAGIRIPFKIQSRADLLTHEHTVKALASAGCAEVWIGAESGSQKILDAMEKGTTVEQIARARQLLRRHHVDASFFLQFGYPGETAEDIRSTIRMVKDLLPDDIGISVSYPLPGTKFYERVKADLTLKQNWVDSDDLAMMYHSTFSPAYYKRLHRYAHKVFRIRQARAFLGELLRFRHPLSKKYARRIAALAWYLPSAAVDRLRLHLLAGNHSSDPGERRVRMHTGQRTEPNAERSSQRTTEASAERSAERSAQRSAARSGEGFAARFTARFTKQISGRSQHHEGDEPDGVARAFSAQSQKFDGTERDNPILHWMRGQVHRHMEPLLRHGETILDINAGTGIDAIHFALRGHPVTAIDIADGMIAELQKKIAARDLGGLVQARCLSYSDLRALRPQKFQHALSDFGGLNCTRDLGPVADGLRQVLVPGGSVTLVIMPPVCPWEVLQAAAGRFSLAFRRFRKNGTPANIEGHHFLTYYHSPADAIRSFGPHFSVVSLRGLASLSPPPSMDAFPRRFPRTYRFLTRLDEALAAYPPFNRWADHYILTLRYMPGDGSATATNPRR